MNDYERELQRQETIEKFITIYEEAPESVRHELDPMMKLMGHMIEFIDNMNKTFTDIDVLTYEVGHYGSMHVKKLDKYMREMTDILNEMKVASSKEEGDDE